MSMLTDVHDLKEGFAEGHTPRAVLFEPAGVLYDATPRRRWLWQLVTRLGIRVSYDDFFRRWEMQFLPDVHRGARRYVDALHEFLSTQGLSAADLDEVQAAVPERSRPLESGVRPLPGVVRMLSRLAADGLSLGVLSDSSHTGQELREHLDTLGLGGRFEVVLTSVDLGMEKPVEQNYEAAAAALHVRPEEVVFVSSVVDDLLGAIGCGMQSIGCNLPIVPEGIVCVPTSARLAEVICQRARVRAAL